MLELHELLKGVLAQLGRKLGYTTTTEFEVADSKIDLVWQRNDDLITIEIEVSAPNSKTRRNSIRSNLEKCLALNPTKHIHIALDEGTLALLQQEQRERDFQIIFFSKGFALKKGSTTIRELIIDIVKRNPMIRILGLKEILCDEMGLCTPRTVERYVKLLAEKEHRIEKIGERNAKLLALERPEQKTLREVEESLR